MGLIATCDYNPGLSVFTDGSSPVALASGQPSGFVTSNQRAAALARGSLYLAQVGISAPYLAIWRRSGSTYTAVTVPTLTGGAQALAWSPDGSMLAVGQGYGGYTGITVYQVSGTTATVAVSGLNDAGAVYALGWSPDGSRLVAVGSAALAVYTVSGTTFTLTSGVPALTSTSSAAVSWADSSSFVVAAGGTTAYLYTLSGGTWTRTTASGSATTITGVACSSDGAYLAVVNTNANLYVYSRSGTTFTALTTPSGVQNAAGVAWAPGDSTRLLVTAGSVSGSTTTWLISYTRSGTAVTKDGTQPTAPNGYAVGPLSWQATNTAPNAPTLNSPANNATIDRGITQRFAWTFSDPDAGDSQSKFDLQYRTVGGSTWTTVTGTTPNTYRDFAAGTFAAGDYEWQVRTYDSQGVVGPWSSSSFFTAADAPAMPTITAPTSGGTVSSTATLTWSAPNQSDYEWRRVKDNAGNPDTSTIYQDSGDVVSSTTRSVALTFDTNNRYEHLQVRVKYNGLWSAWSSIRVLVSYTPPAAPTFTLLADNTDGSPTQGSMGVSISNPAPGAGQPAVSYNNVYVTDPGKPEERRATNLAPNTAWTYRTPPSGFDGVTVGRIRIEAVATNGTTASS